MTVPFIGPRARGLAAATSAALCLTAATASVPAQASAAHPNPGAAPSTALTTAPTPGACPTPAPRAAAPRRFTWRNYAYTIELSGMIGTYGKARVTVRRGTVVRSVWRDTKYGHTAGTPARGVQWRRSIAGWIRLARAHPGSQITWPAARPAPRWIYVDYDQMMADEETTARLSGVRRLPAP